MKKLAFIGLIYTMLGFVAFGQSCVPGQGGPCYQTTVTNANTLPQVDVLWSCMGSATTCSQTALNDAITQQAASGCSGVNSTWSCVTFSQTKSPQAYNSPVQYGALMNYAVSGGGAAGPTPIATFQVPQAPQPLVLSGSSTLITTGAAGPQ